MDIRAERMTRMATIEIKMLGGFEIRVNGKPVLAQLAQSRKATALVQYLVLRRGERVSHKVLTDTLWAGERSTNPDMALRAILHRFRLMIDAEGLDEMKGCIVTSRGYYQWNPHLDCSVDVFEVNDLSELARKESDAEKRSRIYEQIVNLYDGRLLPQSASEPWVESVSVRLHGQYRTAILNLLELCKKWGESTRIVTLCTRALELDPYEERLYLEKIVALETLGRHEEAEDLARRGSAMGCLHHAIEPGRAGSAYRQMRQADRNMESEVSKLISALPDTDNTGACICDFETFKEIYRVQRGVQVRYGLQVFLAILTVAPSQNTDAAETALMVEQLGDLIRTNLRQCDVGARYTDMQYVVMLSGSTAESGTSPLERIKAAFYRIPAHGRYLLSYSLYVPEAKADSGRARRRKIYPYGTVTHYDICNILVILIFKLCHILYEQIETYSVTSCDSEFCLYIAYRSEVTKLVQEEVYPYRQSVAVFLRIVYKQFVLLIDKQGNYRIVTCFLIRQDVEYCLFLLSNRSKIKI